MLASCFSPGHVRYANISSDYSVLALECLRPSNLPCILYYVFSTRDGLSRFILPIRPSQAVSNNIFLTRVSNFDPDHLKDPTTVSDITHTHKRSFSVHTRHRPSTMKDDFLNSSKTEQQSGAKTSSLSSNAMTTTDQGEFVKWPNRYTHTYQTSSC